MYGTVLEDGRYQRFCLLDDNPGVARRSENHLSGVEFGFFSIEDESDLTLVGFLAFFDPPKQSARETIKDLKGLGVSVKILTGDNEIVTRKICEEVGMEIDKIILIMLIHFFLSAGHLCSSKLLIPIRIKATAVNVCQKIISDIPITIKPAFQ